MQLAKKKLTAIGGSVFIFSIIFRFAIFPAILNAQVKHQIALKKGSVMRGIWGKLPFPSYFHFYLFNITNADEVSNGEKPIVQEVGPYVYDKWHEKTNQIDHEEDDTVSFTVRNHFFFNSEKSKLLTGDEEIIVPNYFSLILVSTILKTNPGVMSIIAKAINSIFKNPESLFIKAKVKDILFDGITMNCDVKDFAGNAVCSEVHKNYEEYHMKSYGNESYGVSLWGALNGTDQKARFRVKRGIKNMMDVGKVVEYDNKLNFSTWNDDYCDTFNGTDGTIFHPFFDKKGRDDLVAFNAFLCRGISCHYDSQGTRYSGIKTARYTSDMVVDVENNPLHRCYCKTEKEQCLKKGAFDLYPCSKTPLIVTNPHFYLADPYYRSTVDGLNPVKENHMLFVDIDPFTGTPLYAHARLQLNIFITKVEKVKIMSNFPDALLPLLWFDEQTILPDFLIKDIKSGHTMYTIGKVFQNLMIIGSLATCGFAGFLHYKDFKEKKNNNNNNNLRGIIKRNVPSSSENKMQMNISTVQTETPSRVE